MHVIICYNKALLLYTYMITQRYESCFMNMTQCLLIFIEQEKK